MPRRRGSGGPSPTLTTFPVGGSDVDRIERPGHEAWIEHGSNCQLPLEVVEAIPPKRLLVRIAGEDLPFGGVWTYELAVEGAATRLTVTEDGEIYSPLFRFVARFILGHDVTLRSYLGDLVADLGGEVA